MLVTLAEMKSILGISDNTQDAWLTSQIQLISETVEAYCRRRFLEATYVQKFYNDEQIRTSKTFNLMHYPVSAVSLKEDGVVDTDIRLVKSHGIVSCVGGAFFDSGQQEMEFTYTAGYPITAMPAPLKSAIVGMVEERYNKKTSGVSLNFGSDVQRISVPGTLSIDFDYSLTTNERKNTFGTILGTYLNVLDYYRSERVVTGSITNIEEVP